MALELFNDMNVQMGGKKGQRRKGTRTRITKGKQVRKVRKGTRSKKRRGGSLSSLSVPAVLLAATMYAQKRKRNRSRKASQTNKR